MAKKVTLNPKPKAQNSTTGVGGRPTNRPSPSAKKK